MANPHSIRQRIDKLIKYSAEKYLLPHIGIIKKYYHSSSKYLGIMQNIISYNMTNLFMALYDLYGKTYSDWYKNGFLSESIACDNLILIEYLLNDGADDFYFALSTAIEHDRIPLIHLFLNYYKDQLIAEQKEKEKSETITIANTIGIGHILFQNMNVLINNAKSVEAIKILFLDPDGPADDYTMALLHGIVKLNLEIVQWVVEHANNDVNINYAFNQIPSQFSEETIQYDDRLHKIIKYLAPLVTNDIHGLISII
jgi:hypothetical protein